MQYAILNFINCDGQILIKLNPLKKDQYEREYEWSEDETIKFLDKIIACKNVRVGNSKRRKAVNVTSLKDKSDTYVFCFSELEGDEILDFDSDDDAKLWFEMEYNL